MRKLDDVDLIWIVPLSIYVIVGGFCIIGHIFGFVQ